MTSTLIKSRHRNIHINTNTNASSPSHGSLSNYTSPFLKNPEHQKAKSSSICRCSLCLNPLSTKELSEPILCSNSMIVQNVDRSNMEIIMSSIVGKNKRKGLHVQIPETCFYKDGKPEMMYFNTHNEVKVLNARRFSNRQILKEFLKRRKEAKQNFQQLIEANSREYEEIHEKYFERLKPSYKEKIDPEELEEKMYRVNRDSKFQILEDKETSQEEACITHFSDGSTILLNQGQFGSIKNNSNHLSKLQYIQVLIPCKETVVAEFNEFSTINHKDLYNTARVDVQILLGEISAFNLKGTPLDEPQEYYNLLKSTPSIFALYETFKIIHYISKLTQIIIYSLKISWSVTKEKYYYLTDIISLRYKQKDPREIKQLLANQLQLLKTRNSSQIHEIQKMQEVMVTKWRNLKMDKKLSFSTDVIVKSPGRVKMENNYRTPQAKSEGKQVKERRGSRLLPKINKKGSLSSSQFF